MNYYVAIKVQRQVSTCVLKCKKYTSKHWSTAVIRGSAGRHTSKRAEAKSEHQNWNSFNGLNESCLKKTIAKNEDVSKKSKLQGQPGKEEEETNLSDFFKKCMNKKI